MSHEKINKKEFDEKVTKAVKYGFSAGLIIAFIVILLDLITGAKGKIAEYAIIAIGIGGSILAIGAILYGLAKLRFKKS